MKFLQLTILFLFVQTMCLAQIHPDLKNSMSDEDFEFIQMDLSPEFNAKPHSVQLRNEYVIDSMHFFIDDFNNLYERLFYENYNYRCYWTTRDRLRFDAGNWQPFRYDTQTFTSNGFPSTWFSSNHDGIMYNETFRRYFTYDGDFRTSYAAQAFDASSQTWMQSDSSSYVFQNDFLSEIYNYTWDESSGEWIPVGKVTYDRDADGNLTERLTEDFDPLSQMFVNGSMTYYYYSATTTLRDSLISAFWDGGAWQNSRRGHYIYDGDFLMTYDYQRYDIDLESWQDYFKLDYTPHPTIDQRKYSDFYIYDNMLGEFALNSREEYFYSFNPLETTTINENDIELIMANPFEGNAEMTIKGLDLDQGLSFVVYDISGNKVLESTTNNNDNIVFGKHLSAGAYFIQLIQNEQIVLTKKVIKIR